MFKNRIVRRCLREIRPLLAKRYGAASTYTKGQIERTLAEAGLSQKCAVYALALFMSKEDFATLESGHPDLDFQAVRNEIADVFQPGGSEFSSGTDGPCEYGGSGSG